MKTTTITKSLMAGLLVLTSCIKEDRTDCPCWLDIFVGRCEPIARNITVSAFSPGRIFAERIDVRDYPEYYEHTVEKGTVTVGVFAGRTRQDVQGDTLLIRMGCECDSIFTHNSVVDCRYEFARDTVVLHKQFSTVFLKMENPEGGSYPFRLVIRGPVSGIRYTDNEPVRGVFEHEIEEHSDSEYRFRIPRQTDDSITMDVYDGNTLIQTLPLGESIARAMREDGAFTWSSLDLGDIYIGVDYARTSVTVRVNAWEKGDEYHVII